MPMQYDPNHGPLTDNKWVAPDGREGLVKKRSVDGAYWLEPEDGAPTRGWWHFLGANPDGTLLLGQAASTGNLPMTEAFQWGKDQTMKRVKDGAIWLTPKMDPRVKQAGFHVFDQAGNPTMDQAAVARANTGFLPATGRYLLHGGKEVVKSIQNWGAQSGEDMTRENRGGLAQAGVEAGKAVLGAGRSVERLSTIAGPIVKGISALAGSDTGKRAGEIIAREGLSSLTDFSVKGNIADRARHEMEVEKLAQEFSDAADRVTYASVTGKLRQVQDADGNAVLEGPGEVLRDMQRIEELRPRLQAAQAALAASEGQSSTYNEMMDRGIGANIGNLVGEGIQAVVTMGGSKALGGKLATALAKAQSPILRGLGLPLRPLAALEEGVGLAKAATATKRGALKSLVTAPGKNLMRLAGRLEEAAVMNLPGAAREVAQRVGAGEDVGEAVGHTAKGQVKAAAAFAPMLSSRVARLAKVMDQATAVGATVNTAARLGALTAGSTVMDTLTEGEDGLSRAPEHMKNLLFWELHGGLKAHAGAKQMADVVRDAHASRKAINALDVLMENAKEPKDIAEIKAARERHSAFLDKVQGVLDKYNDGKNEEGVKKPSKDPAEQAAEREARENRKAIAKEVMEDEGRTRAQAALLGPGKREEAENLAAMDALLAAMDEKQDHHAEASEAKEPAEVLDYKGTTTSSRGGRMHRTWFTPKELKETAITNKDVSEYVRQNARDNVADPDFADVETDTSATAVAKRRRAAIGDVLELAGKEQGETLGERIERAVAKAVQKDPAGRVAQAFADGGPDAREWFSEELRDHAARRRKSEEGARLRGMGKGRTTTDQPAPAPKGHPDGLMLKDSPTVHTEASARVAMRARIEERELALQERESAAKASLETAKGLPEDEEGEHYKADRIAAVQAELDGIPAEREALAKLKARLDDPAPLAGDQETLRRAQNLGLHRGETIMPEGVTQAFKRAASTTRARLEAELEQATVEASQVAKRLPRQFWPVEGGDPAARIREYLKSPMDREGNALSEAAAAYQRPALEAAAARVEDARARLHRASALEREASSGFEGGIHDPALARHALDHLRSMEVSGKVDEAAGLPHVQGTLARVPEVAARLRRSVEAERERILEKSKAGDWREPEHQAKAMLDLEQREARLAGLELLQDASLMARTNGISLADAVRKIHDGAKPGSTRRKAFGTRGEALEAVRHELERMNAHHENVVDGPLVDLAAGKERTTADMERLRNDKAARQQRVEEEAAGLEKKRLAYEAADKALADGRAKGLPEVELRRLGIQRDLRSRAYSAAKDSHQRAVAQVEGHDVLVSNLERRALSMEATSSRLRSDKSLRDQAAGRWQDEVLGRDTLRDSDGNEAMGLRLDRSNPGRAIDRTVTRDQAKAGVEPFLMNRAEAEQLFAQSLTPEEAKRIREELKDPNSEMHDLVAVTGKGALVPARAAAEWAETASGSSLAGGKLKHSRYVEHQAYRLEDARAAIESARKVIGSELRNEPNVRANWKSEKVFGGYTIGEAGNGRVVAAMGNKAFRPAEGAIAEFRGDNAFLSNMVRSQVKLDGVVYPTVEHAFQASKTMDPAERQKILAAEKAGEAKRLGGPKGVITKREGHDAEAEAVMKALLHQKFQHPRLREALLKTGERDLVEGNAWGDEVWGATRKPNGDFVGHNRLGKLLMEVRQEIRENRAPESDNLELGSVATEKAPAEKRATAPEAEPGTRFANHPAAGQEVAEKALAAFDSRGGAALRFESTEALLDRLAAHGAMDVTSLVPTKTIQAGGEIPEAHSLTGKPMNAMQAVREGLKTASTRFWKETPAVGELIRMESARSGQPGDELVVTAVEPITMEQAVDPAWVAAWCARNGRNAEFFKKAILPKVQRDEDVLEVRYERKPTFGLEAGELDALLRVMDQTHQPEMDPRLTSYETALANQRRKLAGQELASQDENVTRFSDEAARAADLGGDLRDYTEDGVKSFDADSFEQPAAQRAEEQEAGALAKNWAQTRKLARRAFDKLVRAGVILPGDVKLEREGKLAASDTVDAAITTAANRLASEVVRPGSETAPEAEKVLEAMNALAQEHRSLVQDDESGSRAKSPIVEAARQRRLAKRALDGIVHGIAVAPELDPHVAGIVQEHLATVAASATHEGDVILEHLAGFTSTRDWDGEFRVPRLSSEVAERRRVDWHGEEAGDLVDAGGTRMAKEELEALADPANPRHAETVEAYSNLLREVGIDPELDRPDLLPTTRIRTSTPEDVRITALAQAQKFLDDVAATKEHKEVLDRWKRESKGILHKDWENRVRLFEGNFAEGSLERALAGSFIRAMHPELARRVAVAETSKLAEMFTAMGDSKMANRAAEMEARGSIASFDTKNNMTWLHSAWSEMRANPLRGGEAWRALSHEMGHFVVQAMDPTWHTQTAEAYSRWIQKAASRSELMRRLGLDLADRAAELAHDGRIVLSQQEADGLRNWAVADGSADLRMMGVGHEQFGSFIENDGAITTFNWEGLVDAATGANQEFYKFRNADEWWAEAWKGFISEASSGRLVRRDSKKMEALLDGLAPQDVKRMMAAGDVLRAMDRAGKEVPLQASKPITKALRAMFGPDGPALRSSDPMTLAAALSKHSQGCEVLDLKPIDPGRFKKTRPDDLEDWASLIATEEGQDAGRAFIGTEMSQEAPRPARGTSSSVGKVYRKGGVVQEARPFRFTPAPEPKMRNVLLERVMGSRSREDVRAMLAATDAMRHGFGRGAVARALGALGNLVDRPLHSLGYHLGSVANSHIGGKGNLTPTEWLVAHISADAMNANTRKFGGWMQYEDARDTSARTLDEVRSERIRRAITRDHGHLFAEKVQKEVASIVRQTSEAMAQEKTRRGNGADIFQYSKPIEETGETCRFLGRTSHPREGGKSFFMDRWEVMHEGEKFLVSTTSSAGKYVGIVRIMPQRVFDLYRHLEEGGERTDALGPRTNASLEAWKKHKGEMDAWRWNELTDVYGVDRAALDAAKVAQYFPHIYAWGPKKGLFGGMKQDRQAGLSIGEQNGMEHGLDSESLVNLDHIKARKYQTLKEAWEQGGLLPRHDNPIEAYMQAGRNFQAMTSLRRTVGAMIDRGLAAWAETANPPAGMVDFPLDRSVGSALDALGFKGLGSSKGNQSHSLYVDKTVAPLIRNAFGKGLSATPLAGARSAAMRINNAITPIKLTLSAFHLGTISKLGMVESFRSVASAYAQERRQAKMDGAPKLTRTECLARAAERMGDHAALYGAKREGQRVQELLLQHGMKNLDQLRQEHGLSDLDKATILMFQLGNYSPGRRPSLENAHLDGVMRRWMEYRSGGKSWNLVPMAGGTALHVVGELQNRLMEGVVSPVKAGHLSTDFQRFLKARYDTAEDGWFEGFAHDALTAKPVQGNRLLPVGRTNEANSPYESTEAQLYARNMVSHADNVFGLVNYRRLMMHPVLKDLSQAWYLSFGWRLGNTRLILKAADKALNYAPVLGSAYRGMKRGLGGTGIHGAEPGQDYLGYVATHAAVDGLINTALVSLGALYWPKSMNPAKRDDDSRLGACLQVFQDLMLPAISNRMDAHNNYTRVSQPGYIGEITAFISDAMELARHGRVAPILKWGSDNLSANSAATSLLGDLMDGKDAIGRKIGSPYGLMPKERAELLAKWMANPTTDGAMKRALEVALYTARLAEPMAIAQTERLHDDMGEPYWKAALTGIGFRQTKASRIVGESPAVAEGLRQRAAKQMKDESGMNPLHAEVLKDRNKRIADALEDHDASLLKPAERRKHFARDGHEPLDRMESIFVSLPTAGRVAMLEKGTKREVDAMWKLAGPSIERAVREAVRNEPREGEILASRLAAVKAKWGIK